MNLLFCYLYDEIEGTCVNYMVEISGRLRKLCWNVLKYTGIQWLSGLGINTMKIVFRGCHNIKMVSLPHHIVYLFTVFPFVVTVWLGFFGNFTVLHKFPWKLFTESLYLMIHSSSRVFCV